jgi:acyl-coenzyme A synthetase/AMP-(fatty) acid ligase
VGTIVAVIPKATPTPAAVASIPDERDQEEPKKDEITAAEKAQEKTADTNAAEPEKKVEVVVTDNIPAATETGDAAESDTNGSWTSQTRSAGRHRI